MATADTHAFAIAKAASFSFVRNIVAAVSAQSFGQTFAVLELVASHPSGGRGGVDGKDAFLPVTDGERVPGAEESLIVRFVQHLRGDYGEVNSWNQ